MRRDRLNFQLFAITDDKQKGCAEPMVSVIIPAYCAARFIRRSLASVLAQTYRNFEVIVVDDGSTDETATIVREVMKTDSRVKLLCRQNKGPAAARNLAIEYSAGRYIAPIDADDIWMPTYLERQVNSLSTAPNTVAISYSWSLDIDESDQLTGGFHASNIEGRVKKTLLCHYFPANLSCLVIDRQCFDSVGRFNSEFYRGCEDWDLLLRLASRFQFTVLKEFLVLYRKCDNSRSRNCQRMAESHRKTLEESVARGFGAPGLLHQLSLSLFYTYLAQQCIGQHRRREALHWLWEAVRSACLFALIRPTNYLLAFRALFGLGLNDQAKNVSELTVGVNEAAVTTFRNGRSVEIGLKLVAQDVLHRIFVPLVFALTTSNGKEPDGLKERSVFTFDQRQDLDSLISEKIDMPGLQKLSQDVTVSIVVPTFDRPDQLRECLLSLIAQESSRACEVIVVDNNPSSGLTPYVVSSFPSVKLVSEWRQGASYARNAGINASSGQICVFIDDDAVAPPFWLERLLGPFSRESVVAVTGNVFPYELNTSAAKLFEGYANGGFNRGFKRWQADPAWLRSFRIGAAKTWLIGGSGNAAFRVVSLRDPEIGAFREFLGAGMPSGGSEDNYLLYRLIKAGGTVAYEPSAFVWHKHRADVNGLRHQLFNYSKGFVAYHATTLVMDGDWRAVPSLMHLPWWHLSRIFSRLVGRSSYPISLILVEALGHLVGLPALARSIQITRQRQANHVTAFAATVPSRSEECCLRSSRLRGKAEYL